MAAMSMPARWASRFASGDANTRCSVDGRCCGAGFGGSILALVAREKTAAFTAAMDRPVLTCSTADGAFSR